MTQSSTDVAPSSAAADSQIAGSLALLTTEQRQRLTVVLDRYLSALEQDIPIAQDALLAEHPDLADALRSYFRSLEDLHDMAAGFGGAAARALPPESHDDTAKRVGDFELIREIGRGGMGVVYEARQISLDRRVAVKLLPFAAVLDSKQIARFKHEAQAAAHLQHPNIVPVFAIGVERGVHYYAMQYIDGQPLDRAIEELRQRVRGSGFRVQEAGVGGRESGVGGREHEGAAATVEYSVLSTEHDGRRSAIQPLRRDVAESPASRLVNKDNRSYFRRVAELGVQTAEALHAAHEYGVVHRDIKPSNLLLAADGKLWVTDFGLARFQRDASLTRSGDLVGTMRYMSPEQATGQSALVDHRTDIYSLGVTLYELACLQPAFPEDRGPALLRQIDSVDPPRPRHIRPDMPADLETVILKAMARDRDERYATAQQLADDLTCVLDGKATQARPPTVVDRVGRWARRHRRIVIASVIGLVVAIVGLSTSTLLIAIQTQRAKAAAQSADRRYQVAREMLDRLGLQIAEQLVDVPGADVVRQQLLDETRRYYLSFIEETKFDPVLRVDAALAYGKIGGLLELLGSAEESLAAHQQSAKILSDLAAHSHSFAIERQLGQAENNVALALRRVGKTAEAMAQFEQAIRRQEKLLARQPQDVALAAELALTLGNIGLLQHETQQPGTAQSSLQAAIDHFRPALAHSPDDVDLRQKLAGAYNNLAATHLDSRPAESARLHGQALDLLRAAAQTSPGNLALRRDVGRALNNLGLALSHAQQPAAAQAAYEQAIEIREELVRLAAARTSYRTDLAVSLNNLGMLENRSGQTEAAQAKFRRAVELYESLASQFPSDLTIHSNLGSVYNNLGVSLERTEQLELAATAFASAVNHQRLALELAPDLARCRELLLKHYESQRRVMTKLGRAAEAAQATQAIERLTAIPNSTHRQP